MNTYTEDLERVEDQLREALRSEGESSVSSGNITCFSLMDEELLEYSSKRSFRGFYRGMKRYHTGYVPGETSKVLVIDGRFSDIGIDIRTERTFGQSDFETMVDEVWSGKIGYSWRETINKLRRQDDRSLRAIVGTAKEVIMLVFMKLYRRVFARNLIAVYSISDDANIRFFSGEDYNYVNLTGNPNKYDHVLSEAEKITRYLESLGMEVCPSPDFENRTKRTKRFFSIGVKYSNAIKSFLS